jgi:curved DNA-binding protein
MDEAGRVHMDTRTLSVKIPKGVREVQLILLSGQGEPVIGGAAAGDLLLEVHFKPHPRFRVEGRNLHLDLPVAPWEAALGAIIPLDLPSGPLKLRIPAGTQDGRQLRVRGKGIPGDPPGDLILDIRIVLPPADTPRARELYEAMARDLAFDPRQRS